MHSKNANQNNTLRFLYSTCYLHISHSVDSEAGM